jgi:hypothetical protein
MTLATFSSRHHTLHELWSELIVDQWKESLLVK